MTTKHTPGPWTNEEQIGVTFGPDGKPIQTGGAGCSEETQANARLIAAAPEMLEALQSISKSIHHSVLDGKGSCAKDCPPCIALEAIAKTEGMNSKANNVKH